MHLQRAALPCLQQRALITPFVDKPPRPFVNNSRWFGASAGKDLSQRNKTQEKSEGKQHLGLFVDKRWGNLSTIHNLVKHRLHNPASFGNHRAASHLVGKWARMRKIFLFGAGLSGVNPRSPDACSARPGLLRISDNLDSAIWTESTPRSTPNGNILRIRAKKTTTCRRESQKGSPKPKKRRAANPSARRTREA